MPAHQLKHYVKGEIYHVFNRGINKDTIFQSLKDYGYFMRILKESLTPKELLIQEYSKLCQTNTKYEKRLFRLKGASDHSEHIKLLAFCLMPNHFHLLFQQLEERSIIKFMRSIQVRYSVYFNKKNRRIGPLFQGRYQAINVTSLSYLMTVSRYIHLNPVELSGYDGIKSYPWSSLKVYTGRQNLIWVDTDILTREFSNSAFSEAFNDYIDFTGVRP